MGDYTFGDAVILLPDGSELKTWKEYSIDSDFLTPTDGWSFRFGTEVEWAKVHSIVLPDTKIQIVIDGNVQCTGWIDKVHAECGADEGVVISVEGRDILKAMVKSNIHPSTRIKNRTIADLVESALQQIYQTDTPTVVFDNAANRQLITGAKARHKGKRKRKTQSELEYCQPHANESAFSFISRNLRRFGLWIWAAADGSLVIDGPNYDQPASYQILRRHGDVVVQVERAAFEWDKTNVPSHVYVRGKSKSKDWEKQDAKGSALDPDFRLFAPAFMQHDEATTDAECTAFAEQEMSKAKQDERVYTCTVKGHRDPHTGLIYATDTIAHVEDEPLGVSGDFYVVRRTFHKSVDGGTTTELKLVPKYSIQFSDADAPEPGTEEAPSKSSGGQSKAKSKTTNSDRGFLDWNPGKPQESYIDWTFGIRP